MFKENPRRYADALGQEAAAAQVEVAANVDTALWASLAVVERDPLTKSTPQCG